jgi:MoaA/NifB/PqqE/SkfB family radical SAM enzyme
MPESKALQPNYIAVLNRGLRLFFSEFIRVSLSHPGQALHFFKVANWQRKAARLRARWSEEGLHVPPIVIFSITNRCNLACKGCYAQAIRGDSGEELSGSEMRDIIAQADDLGTSFFVIAGGEPLTRPEFLDIARDFPHIVFLLFTNGLLLDDALISRLKAQANTVPVLSLEGRETDTDGRRGKGVHERLEAKMRELRKAGIFFSISFTVTRYNYQTVTDRAFIKHAVKAGCGFFLFAEYTPVRAGTDDWVITDEQRSEMKGVVESFRKTFPSVFIAVPWDEEETGGCLASGRGFVHISAEGDLEPCPFAPYSDTNLRNVPLKQALASRFLESLRENHDRLTETEGGCALWQKRDLVKSLLEARA